MKLKHLFLSLILITYFLPTAFSQNCTVDLISDYGVLIIINLQQDANAKLFDSNIQSVWGCDPWNGSPCGVDELVNGLISGDTYYLSVQSNTCDEWIPVVINGVGPVATCSDGIQNQGEDGIDCGGPCAPCQISECNVIATSENGAIQVSGLTADANTKLFDANISSVWECNPWNGSACTENAVITGLTTGDTYFLSVQSTVCAEWIPVTVQGDIGCPDTDGDGVCNDVDCDPENPAFPGVPGASCDDNEPLTENDVISADGCSCTGVIIEPMECDVNATPLNNSITVTGLSADANTKLFDSAYNVVWSCDPWNGAPCSFAETISSLPGGATYFLSVQSSTCDVWLEIMTEGNVDNNECSESLGEYMSTECVEFLENGSVRIVVETAENQYSREWFDEFGEYISSTPVTLANSLAIEGDRIIERNSFGNIVRDVPIDPDILTMYSQSGGKIRAVTRHDFNQYALVGSVPEGGAGNEPFFDLIYGHLISAGTGLENFTNVFFEIDYTQQDYEVYGENFYTIEGIISIANGNGPVGFQVYLEQYPSGIITDFPSEIRRFDLTEDFFAVNETVIKSNANDATFIDLEIEEDLCDEDRFQITCYSNNLDSGFEETIVERIDHGYFQPFLRSRITTTSTGDGGTETYLLETDYVLSEFNIQLFASGPESEGLFPGEFAYGRVDDAGNFTIDGYIELNEPPVSAFQNFDGTYNIVTEENDNLTWYTTNCEEMPNNDIQSLEAEKVENAITINNLFPNPTVNEVFLKLESKTNTGAKLNIYDVAGKSVLTKTVDLEIGLNAIELSTAHLKTGMYNLVLSVDEGQIQSTRFVKN